MGHSPSEGRPQSYPWQPEQAYESPLPFQQKLARCYSGLDCDRAAPLHCSMHEIAQLVSEASSSRLNPLACIYSSLGDSRDSTANLSSLDLLSVISLFAGRSKHVSCSSLLMLYWRATRTNAVGGSSYTCLPIEQSPAASGITVCALAVVSTLAGCCRRFPRGNVSSGVACALPGCGPGSPGVGSAHSSRCLVSGASGLLVLPVVSWRCR